MADLSAAGERDVWTAIVVDPSGRPSYVQLWRRPGPGEQAEVLGVNPPFVVVRVGDLYPYEPGLAIVADGADGYLVQFESGEVRVAIGFPRRGLGPEQFRLPELSDPSGRTGVRPDSPDNQKETPDAD